MENTQQHRQGYTFYKKLGWLPEEWEVLPLGQLFEFKNGVNASKESYGQGVKFINVSEVLNNESLTVDKIPGSVSIPDKSKKIYNVKKGDVLFNRTSETKEEVAYATVYLDDEEVVFGGFVIRGRSTTSKVDDLFKKYCFQNLTVRKQIISRGQGAVRTNIGQKDLSTVLLPLPPLAEQQKIAKILNTWDTAIQTTEQLLATKRQQKKGLMQRLLTGQVRFEEFVQQSGFQKTKIGDVPLDWEVSSFKKHSKVSQGLQIKISDRLKEKVENSYKYITIQFLSKSSDRNNIFYVQNPLNSVICYEEDILMTRTGNTGIVVTNVHGVFHNNFFKVDFDKNKIDKDFMFYYLNNEKIQKLIRIYADGTTIPDLNHGDFYRIVLLIPSKAEQQKIAQVLTAADTEIQQLEQKLSALQAQKQGLMQRLLTGAVRVNNRQEKTS